jgi:hypothetical protein
LELGREGGGDRTNPLHLGIGYMLAAPYKLPEQLKFLQKILPSLLQGVSLAVKQIC